MKILIACEESQAVCKAFRANGHEAYSCDILPCSGGHPEWHLQQDITPLLKQKWDMIIAFPPCTYLTVTGNRWFKPEYAERYPTRTQDREDAKLFFMLFANADCPKIAIENPVGVMSSTYRKPDQIIQPWQFGDKAVKKTCLWLKGLPLLTHTKIVEPEYVTYNSSTKKSGKSRYPMAWSKKADSVERSKTFPGIADAMAEQWGQKKPLEDMKEIVICSAIRMPDGYIIRGHRHNDCIATYNKIPKYKGIRTGGNEHGFVTSLNRFVTRSEGCRIQKEAGIESKCTDERANGGYDGRYLHGELYSEDLY